MKGFLSKAEEVVGGGGVGEGVVQRQRGKVVQVSQKNRRADMKQREPAESIETSE